MIVIYFLAFIGYFTVGNYLMNELDTNYCINYIEEITKWYLYLPMFIVYLLLWPIAFIIDLIINIIKK